MNIIFHLLFLTVSRFSFLISCIMKQSTRFPGHRMNCCMFQAPLWYSSVHVIRELFIKLFPRELSTIITFAIFYICIWAYECYGKLYYAKFRKQCLRINSELQILLFQSKPSICLNYVFGSTRGAE